MDTGKFLTKKLLSVLKMFMNFTPTEPRNDRYAMFGYDGTNFIEQAGGIFCNHLVCLLNSAFIYILIKIVQKTYRFALVRRVVVYIPEDDPVLSLH